MWGQLFRNYLKRQEASAGCAGKGGARPRQTRAPDEGAGRGCPSGAQETGLLLAAPVPAPAETTREKTHSVQPDSGTGSGNAPRMVSVRPPSVALSEGAIVMRRGTRILGDELSLHLSCTLGEDGQSGRPGPAQKTAMGSGASQLRRLSGPQLQDGSCHLSSRTLH